MIRLATTTDIKAILAIVEDARCQIEELGFIQWSRESGYPSASTFMTDIANNELYVIEENVSVLGFMALVKSHNFDYDNIEGKWLNDANYYTIHRLAIKKTARHQGLAIKLIEWAKNIASANHVSLRIDTHLKNIPMQNLILRTGFTYCGIIKLAKEKLEPERKAYEWLYKKGI